MVFKKIALVAAVAFMALSSSTVDAEGAFYNKYGVLQVGKNEALNVNVASGASREDVISYPLASYISVRFSAFDIPEGDEVVVRSPDFSVIHTYTGKGRDDRSNFVASFVPGSSAVVQYISRNKESAATAGRGYTISGFSRGFPEKLTESICGGTDNTVPAKCFLAGQNGSVASTLPLAYERSQAVARLLINGTSLCTGWLAGSEGHLFTNQHCIDDPALAAVTDIEFGAESTSCMDECKKQLGCPGSIVAKTSTFITNNDEHDYALVKLPATAKIAGYKYLQLRESGPKLGEEIYIPQHPRGYPKRIASVIEGNEPAYVQTLHGTTGCGSNQVGYAADTQGGSSGSPVLAKDDNAVIALHHCGGCENTAVDIQDVIADLRKKNIVVKDLIASSSTPAPTTPAPTTQAPTPVPTTQAPTVAPTPVPTTKAPTAVPTVAPTTAPTAAPGRLCGAHATKAECDRFFFCKWDNNACKRGF